MPPICCIKGCLTKYGEADTSFHRFPAASSSRDLLRRELWAKTVSLNMDIANRSFVCGRHFVTGMFFLNIFLDCSYKCLCLKESQLHLMQSGQKIGYLHCF